MGLCLNTTLYELPETGPDTRGVRKHPLIDQLGLMCYLERDRRVWSESVDCKVLFDYSSWAAKYPGPGGVYNVASTSDQTL